MLCCHYIYLYTCTQIIRKNLVQEKFYIYIQFIRHFDDLQVELLLPDRIEVAINGLGSLLSLAHLNSDIWITGSCLVLCLKSLGTHNYRSDGQTQT